MARVKYSSIITDISGSVGGLTFQRNKFGNTVRQKPLPVNSRSLSQYHIRQLITTIQAAWQDLSDEERLQWDRFLDFSGQTIKSSSSVKLSGHSLYLKYQLYRLLAGLSLLTTITYIPMPSACTLSSAAVAANFLQISINAVVTHTEKFFLFSMTTPRQSNQASSPSGLRYMYTVPATAGSFRIEDAYEEAFGVLPPALSTFHYSILTFSMLAPLYSGRLFGKFTFLP